MISAPAFVSALNRVVFPALGRPTMPTSSATAPEPTRHRFGTDRTGGDSRAGPTACDEVLQALGVVLGSSLDVVEHRRLGLDVARFNEGVRTGDIAPMLEGFTADVVMTFRASPVGLFVGREGVAAPMPSSRRRMKSASSARSAAEDGSIVADYAWAADGARACRMVLTVTDGRIVRLTVTFE